MNVLLSQSDVLFISVHVAEQMNRDDEGYLEALEKETTILQKRVDACKARIMMVTCFDIVPTEVN